MRATGLRANVYEDVKVNLEALRFPSSMELKNQTAPWRIRARTYSVHHVGKNNNFMVVGLMSAGARRSGDCTAQRSTVWLDSWGVRKCSLVSMDSLLCWSVSCVTK